MPPERRIASSQRKISWTVASTPTRSTPSRSTRIVIQNYSQLERSEVNPQNPPSARRSGISTTNDTQTQQDEDIEMDNGEGG